MNNDKGLNFDQISPEIETIPPKPPDLMDLKARSLEIRENVKVIVIENTEERIAVESQLVVLAKIINSFKDLLNPGIDAARSTLNVLKGKRDELLDPLLDAKKAVNLCLGDYYQKEDKERRRLQAIEDKKLKDARIKTQEALAAVVKAEDEGDIKKADEILENQAKIEIEIVTTPPVQMPPPKMKGISSRMIPKWEVTDPSRLPENYRTIVPIRPKITGLIRAHGPEEAMRLCPGIRAWEEPSTTVRG